MPATPYCYGTEGNSAFIRGVVDALDGTLEPFFQGAFWTEDSSLSRRVPWLHQDERVRAFGMIEIAGAFTVFVASCFGKKIFDELYDRLLKRPLEPFIDKLCRSGAFSKDKAVEIRDVVYLSDIETTVVIRAAATADTAPEVAALFLEAHRVAHSYLARNGPKAPIHCHTIVDGKVSIEPQLFLSLEHLTHEVSKE